MIKLLLLLWLARKMGKIFSLQWIHVTSYKADRWRESVCSLVPTSHSVPVESETGGTGGLWVHHWTSEKGRLLSDLGRICFPKKEMIATSTALGSWAKLEEPNYKELNLFLGKHRYRTVIWGERNPARRKDSRTPRTRANGQPQQGAVPLRTYVRVPCLYGNIQLSHYFLHFQCCPSLWVRNAAPTNLSPAITLAGILSTSHIWMSHIRGKKLKLEPTKKSLH